MNPAFDKDRFHGDLLKGDLTAAMAYLAGFPERAELHRKYLAVFKGEEYPILAGDDGLDAILLVYQKYYRDVFYLRVDAARAEAAMKDRLARLFHIEDPDVRFEEIEAREVAAAFQGKFYHFLGGKTGGYWGPYIWKTTESRTYDVELPGGVQPYEVRFLDGFIAKSWCDYISFGEIGTGGWTDGDGIIHCVKASYDLAGEGFIVSLLKHEAQHAADLARYQNMSSEDLEYRAKLVELIYSSERNLLQQFACEADASKANNGHSLAANRIVSEFESRLRGEGWITLPIAEIQTIARVLFDESDAQVRGKYGE